MAWQTYSYKDPVSGRDRYRTEWIDDPENDYYFQLARTTDKVVVIASRKDTPKGLKIYNFRRIVQEAQARGLKVVQKADRVEAELDLAWDFCQVAKDVLGMYYQESAGAQVLLGVIATERYEAERRVFEERTGWKFGPK